MSNYAVINLKTNPELKKQAAAVADKLGISISAVLNNELRRFTIEESVTFDVPEVPNERTARLLAALQEEFAEGDVYGPFDAADAMLADLHKRIKSDL